MCAEDYHFSMDRPTATVEYRKKIFEFSTNKKIFMGFIILNLLSCCDCIMEGFINFFCFAA